MSPGWIDLRQLRYFIAAAEDENFRRAATRMNVAQPALSRQIRELEESLGVQLFERRNKRVFLTKVGRFYLNKSKTLVAQAATFSNLAKRMHDGTNDRIKIGLQEIATRHQSVLDIVRSVRRKLPGVDLSIASMTSPEQIAALLSGDIDVGFLYDVPEDSESLESLRLSVDGFGLAIPVDHPLVYRDVITVSDLRSMPQIILSEPVSPSLYKRIIGACRAAGFDPVIAHQAKSEHDVFCLVSSGCGVALMTTPHLQRIGIAYRKVEGLDIPRALSLVWHRDNEQPVLHRILEIARIPNEQNSEPDCMT